MKRARSLASLAFRCSLLAYPRHHRARFADELTEFFHLRIGDDESLAKLFTTTLANTIESLRTGTVERIMTTVEWGRSWKRQIGRGVSNLRALVRSLKNEPGFYVLACITAAIGIGVGSGIASVANTVLLSPLPYPDSDRMYLLQTVYGDRAERAPTISRLNFEDWREQNSVFEDMLGALSTAWIIDEPEGRTVAFGAFVTDNFFSRLTASPALGRLFVASDFEEGSEAVAVLSHDYWSSTFGSDPDVVGSSLRSGDETFTVIGVTSPQWVPPEAMNQRHAKIWLPISQRARRAGDRDNGDVRAVGILKPDVQPENAEVLLQDLRTRINASLPDNTGGMADFRASQRTRLQQLKIVTLGSAYGSVGLLAGATVFLFLLAAANVINMFIARGVHRNREFAVRTSLGGNRGALAALLTWEGLALGVMTGLLAIPVANWTIGVVAAFGPEDLPRLEELGSGPLDLAITGVLGIALLVSASLSQLIPWRNANLLNSLKSGQNDTSSRFSIRLRSSLVVVQVASSVVLLVGGGLLLNSYVRLIGTDPGFDPQGLAHARMFMAGIDEPARWNILQQMKDEVQAIPGVTHVAMVDRLPMTFGTMGSELSLNYEGEWYTTNTSLMSVSQEYFDTMRIPVLEGTLGRQPGGVAANASIMGLLPENATLANIGINYGQPDTTEATNSITAIVGDTHHVRLGEPAGPIVYEILDGEAPFVMYLVARFEQVEGQAIVRQLRSVIKDIAPSMPIEHHGLLMDDLNASVANPRFYALLTTIYSAAASLLACAGLFAALSQMVARRRREIGIRMALGASATRVMQSYLGKGATIAATGVAIGVPFALLLSRYLESRLYAISAHDPATVAGVALLMITVALAAACLQLEPQRQWIR